MKNLAGEQLGTGEGKNEKNHRYFLNSVLSNGGIGRLKREVLNKNFMFNEMLSLYSGKIKYFSTDLEGSGYKFQNMFFIEDEDEDYIKYMIKNIDMIRSGELLFGFLYEDMTIKGIVFAKQLSTDKEISDLMTKVNLEFCSLLSEK
ncbi:MAG: hypothetical protein PHI37_03520 [Candidatus Gracilibacteria bacterium]|nr:hypothetical protein [Candidatus Gracilibacteria bacterium]